MSSPSSSTSRSVPRNLRTQTFTVRNEDETGNRSIEYRDGSMFSDPLHSLVPLRDLVLVETVFTLSSFRCRQFILNL